MEVAIWAIFPKGTFAALCSHTCCLLSSASASASKIDSRFAKLVHSQLCSINFCDNLMPQLLALRMTNLLSVINDTVTRSAKLLLFAQRFSLVIYRRFASEIRLIFFQMLPSMLVVQTGGKFLRCEAKVRRLKTKVFVESTFIVL